MKTFRTILATMIITVGIVMGLVGKFLFNEGIVTVEKVSTDHSKVVLIDGEVTEESYWSELMGMKFNIDVVDSAYIGK